MEQQSSGKSSCPLKFIDDEIVISGIGGRYPESDSLDEFRDNLYNNVDMITSDDRRWPTTLYGMTHRMGKLKEIDKFDASFFGIVPKVADEVDPQGRILLETTWEAIVDAGINPQSLRGSNTGVYVGYTSVAMPDGVPQEVQDDLQSSKVESLLWFQGGSKAFYANRVSFLYDFHGPSMSIDIACASSMVCLDIAVTDLRLGKCDQAIVAGVSINLQPFTNHIYVVNNIAAPDGRSKVWDQEANGYVRGETVCSLFLQKRADSKRIYATVLHSKSNIDGYKITGMFFPSSESQYDLMVSTYKEAGIDPLSVNYFESHGTGTKAGDPQEARAILRAYCENRKDKLPIGLLKSNIGHGEGASGVASLSKLCIVFENKKIPANLNLKNIKADIAVMVPPLDPVMENRDYDVGISGINSFGIGGVNAHALLEPNRKQITTESFNIASIIPRLVNINGRTEDAVNYIFDFIEQNPDRVTQEFLTLLGETVNNEPSIYSAGFPCRGSMMIKKSQTAKGYEYARKVSKVDNVKRPICFFFSGMGSQWSGMAKAMMDIEIFANSIRKCAQVLKQVDIDLEFIVLSEDPKALEDKVNHFVAISSVQIALVDVFQAMGVQPDYIIGHSFGEIACAYADRCLTLEQAIITSFWRGKAIKDSNVEHGMMAAIGLTWEETIEKCPPGVYAACHNAVDSVTISGSYNLVDAFVQKLNQEKIFAREVQCANIPFHSPLLHPATERMTKALEKIIPEPKLRSEKWISTSMPENVWSSEKAQKSSPEYFVNNLINPVLFHDASKFIPKNAIIIELASHTLFSAIFKRSMPNADYVGLMRRNNNASNLEFYLNSLGQLYQLGVNLDLKPLYPAIQWPVPRNTQSIGSLMRWDHGKSFLVKKYPDFHFQATASDFVQKFSLANPDDQFLKDHAFDGRCVLPATSYLMIAWRRLAASLGQSWFNIPVVFENVEFKRLIPMSDEEIKLKVRLLDPTGEFVILDGPNIAATGRVRCPEPMELNYQDQIVNFEKENSPLAGHKLDTNEFYTEMNVRGYDYGPKFKQIQQIEFSSFDRSKSLVRWENNFITFVESMIQLYVSHTEKRFLYVASQIASFKCDPKLFYGLPAGELPVITDSDLQFVAAPGIEIKGMKLVNIPLKNVMHNVKMEKYEFVPFDEPKAIEQVDYLDLSRYIDDCETLAKFIVMAGAKSSSQPFIDERLSRILRQTPTDSQVLLSLLVDSYRSVVDSNGNVIGDGKLSPSTVKKLVMDNGYNLEEDLLNCCHKNNGRLIRSSLDTVNENSFRNISIIEANYNGSIMIDDIVQQMSAYFHYPLVVDSLLIRQNIKALSEKLKNSNHKMAEWSLEDYRLPTIESPADLFVFKDSFQLAKLDSERFIQEIHQNVRDEGFMFAVFRSKISKAEKIINDLLDCPVNPETISKRISVFEKLAKGAGFKLISKKSDSLTSTCLLFRKSATNMDPQKQAIVPVHFGRFEEWVDNLKTSFSQYKNRPKNENIWLIADDCSLNGVLGLTNCLRQEPGGDRFRCVYSFSKLPRPFDFTQQPFKDLLEKDLAINVFKDNQWGTYRLLDLERNYDQVETNEAFLEITKKGDMSSIKWFKLPSRKSSNRKQVNIKIHYAGLDQKDLLICFGSHGGIDQLDRSLGTEFAGYRSDSGKPVMGLAFEHAIASSIDIDPRLLVPIPNQWSLEDGASSIHPMFVAWYGLIEQAHLESDETILVHPGTSANGLAAIQMAKHLKCRVLATVSNEEQRKYLMENLAVPSKNIIDFEQEDFVDAVLLATDYQGVDVVLDTFSKQKLNTTLPIVREYGRYVQIDHPKSDPTNPICKTANVHYLNVSSLISEQSFRTMMPKLIGKFVPWFEHAATSFLEPIPRKVFDKKSYHQAFQTIQDEEHIGKILIRIRDTDPRSSTSMAKIEAIHKTLFDANKCYILVGGLGGLGMEIAHWMVIRGARKIVLVSRSGIKNEYQYVFVKRIENAIRNGEEIKVKIATTDPSSLKGAEKLIRESQVLGPVGGIFHLATVLNDAFIEDQTPDTFKKVCAPKMDALGYLDAITRQLCPELDYFVAFSSQSSSRGFIGQNNYGYANSVMEHICEARKRDGFPGQAIEYGPIGDVGLWVQNEHVDLSAIGMVIDTQRIQSCMEVLDRFLGLEHPIVCTIVRKDQQQNGQSAKVKNHIWQGIGIDVDSLPENLNLGDVGMESILAVEMQQRVEREYEINLTPDEIKKLTVGMIKEFMNANKDAIKQSLIEFQTSK